MRITKINNIFFSPTGGTKRIALAVGNKLAQNLHLSESSIDFTLPLQREQIHQFDENDLVIFAMPVYAGRIPNKILPFVQTLFQGKNTPVVLISVFGNRSFGDSLIELKLELEKQGFLVIAAAAIVNQHVFSKKIATGRPDQKDQKEINDFIDKIVEQISTNNIGDSLILPGNNSVGAYYTPLGSDGNPVNFLKTKPGTDLNLCIDCKACAKVCPMGSISIDNVSLVPGICIKCQACIRVCPTNAKYFSNPEFLSHVKMLEENYTTRSNNEFFVDN